MRFITTLFFIVSCTLHLAAQSPDEGWRALADNNDSAARAAFARVTAADPTNALAWFGASIEASLRNDDSAGWQSLVAALRHVDSLHPYLYAVAASDLFRAASVRQQPEVTELLTKVVDTPDPQGVMWATALHRLGHALLIFSRAAAASAWSCSGGT